MIPDLSPKTLGIKAIGWWFGSGTTPISSSNGSSAGFSVPPSLQYGALAIADPKMPLELKALGPANWAAANFVPMTFLMWHVDPLNLREGEGLDESYYMWSDVRTRVDRVKDPVVDFFSTPPSFWDSWYWFD